uniref:3-dehydrosphinganine reductase n=1 Tax=Anabas testudineus TaxID=64144 RepID=A0A7N6BZM4_ANATE
MQTALSRGERVQHGTLIRLLHIFDSLPNQRTTPPPTSVFRHPLSGPSPASYLGYRTPEAGLLVSRRANDCQISPMSSEEGLSSTITDWLFINSWWLLLPFIMLLVIAAFIVAFVLLLYMISPLISPKPLKLNGAHVVVTGGSSGIGKCIAIECYRQGAFITLVARNEAKLLQAKKEIEKFAINDKQVVLCISVDVSSDYSQVESVIKQHFTPDSTIAKCWPYFHQKLMEVNYLGSVYPTRAVITTMKERRMGRIMFVSSQAGQVGLFGYTAYSPSKFALRGLAESLQMEIKPYNIYVTVAYPPDTDTPGLAEENKTKPLETKLISETSGVCQPDQVAKIIVRDAVQGNFNSSVGPDGYMLSALTCGMSPVTSITEGLQQIITMGLFRTIALFYLGSFDSIVRRCMIQREQSKAADKRE